MRGLIYREFQGPLSLETLPEPEITSRNSIACLRKRGKHIQVGLMTGDHTHPPVPKARILSDELESCLKELFPWRKP